MTIPRVAVLDERPASLFEKDGVLVTSVADWDPDADLPDDDAIVVVTWPGGAQRCVVVESGAIVVRKATDDE